MLSKMTDQTNEPTREQKERLLCVMRASRGLNRGQDTLSEYAGASKDETAAWLERATGSKFSWNAAYDLDQEGWVIRMLRADLINPRPAPTPAPPNDRTKLTFDPHSKDIPLASGALDYFPNALAAVALLSKLANEKHNPGEPMHHARGKSMAHADCILTHLAKRGTIDPEFGLPHEVAVAWRALALLQESLEALGAPMARGARPAEDARPKWPPPEPEGDRYWRPQGDR